MARIGKVKAFNGGNTDVSYNDNLPYRRQGKFLNPPGLDSKPMIGDKVVSVELGDRDNKILFGCQNESKAEEGETRLFAKASAAEVYLDNDGKVRINGDSKSFMTYEQFAENWDLLMEYLEANLPSPPPPDVMDISACQTLTVKTDG